MTIGEVIKNYRKNRKLTQKEFGDLINKTTSAVKKYEAGCNIPKSVLLNICFKLDIAPIEIINKIEDKEEQKKYAKYFEVDDITLYNTPHQVEMINKSGLEYKSKLETDNDLSNSVDVIGKVFIYKTELVDILVRLGMRIDIACTEARITRELYDDLKEKRNLFLEEELYSLGYSVGKIKEILEEG